jgi:hypothetical protein
MKKKTLKLVLGVITFSIAVYVLDILLFNLTDSLGLFRLARQIFPLKGYTLLFCIYLTTLLSIFLVTFVYGFFFWFNHKIAKTGTVLFIIVSLIESISGYIKTMNLASYIYPSITIQQSTFPVPLSMIVPYLLILVIALVSIKKLYSLGTGLREKITHKNKYKNTTSPGE